MLLFSILSILVVARACHGFAGSVIVHGGKVEVSEFAQWNDTLRSKRPVHSIRLRSWFLYVN